MNGLPCFKSARLCPFKGGYSFEDAAQAHTANPELFGLLHFPQPKHGRGAWYVKVHPLVLRFGVRKQAAASIKVAARCCCLVLAVGKKAQSLKAVALPKLPEDPKPAGRPNSVLAVTWRAGCSVSSLQFVVLFRCSQGHEGQAQQFAKATVIWHACCSVSSLSVCHAVRCSQFEKEAYMLGMSVDRQKNRFPVTIMISQRYYYPICNNSTEGCLCPPHAGFACGNLTTARTLNPDP